MIVHIPDDTNLAAFTAHMRKFGLAASQHNGRVEFVHVVDRGSDTCACGKTAIVKPAAGPLMCPDCYIAWYKDNAKQRD